MKKSFEFENLTLIQGNCLEEMDKIYRKIGSSVDLIFADPPYFLSNGGITCQNGKMTKVNKGDWDQSQGHAINHQFNLEWLKRCQKLLTPNGTIFVSGTFHVIYSIGHAMQQLEMRLLNNIIWQKPNPPPNLACRYFTHSSETVIWAAKTEKSKHKFNYPLMKSTNGGKQMKDVWKMQAAPKGERKFGRHPTQKPIALLDRIIAAASSKGNLVLDPFNGSGSTGVACLNLGRRYIGIENEKKYFDLSIKRFKSIQKKTSQSR